MNKTTSCYYFQRLLQVIYDHSEHLELLDGEVVADESYFGGRRKGKRGRGAAGKVPVFGLLQHNGKVFSIIIPDAKTDTLTPIIRQQVKPDSIFTQIHGEATMHYMYQNLNIIGSTIVNYLLSSITTLME